MKVELKGNVVVIDPCYLFSHKYYSNLEIAKAGELDAMGCTLYYSSTGYGDGVYKVKSNFNVITDEFSVDSGRFCILLESDFKKIIKNNKNFNQSVKYALIENFDGYFELQTDYLFAIDKDGKLVNTISVEGDYKITGDIEIDTADDFRIFPYVEHLKHIDFEIVDNTINDRGLVYEYYKKNKTEMLAQAPDLFKRFIPLLFTSGFNISYEGDAENLDEIPDKIVLYFEFENYTENMVKSIIRYINDGLERLNTIKD